MPDKDVKREQEDEREARQDLHQEKRHGSNKDVREAEEDLRKEKKDVKQEMRD